MPGFEQLLLFLFFGLISGLLGGFFGVGGGTIYVPVLTAFYAEKAHLGAPFVAFIIGNSLFLTLISGLSGSFKQYRLRNFHWRPVLFIGLSGALSAVFISMLLTRLPQYNKEAFSWLFTLVLLPMVVRMFLKRKEQVPAERPLLPQSMLGIGLLSGCISALTGLGGGVVMVPLLSERLNMPIRKATSISLGAIVIMASGSVSWYALQTNTAILGPWQWGIISLPAVLPMGLGVLVSAPWGVHLGNRVTPATNKLLFLLFFIIVILQMHFNIFY